MVTPAQVAEKYLAMPSSKHSGKRSITQMLVVHSAESPMEYGYAQSLTNWSNTTGVLASWNAFADPGCVVRAVHTAFAAWHASWANPLSIGYETAAYAAFGRDKWLSLPGRQMLERLAIEMAADAKLFDIPLRWLTGEQVNKIRAGNRKIKGLAAHRQIDPAYRTDPGDGFPYGYLLKRIKHHSGVKLAGSAPQPVEEDDMKEADFDRIEKMFNNVETMIVNRIGDVVPLPFVDKDDPNKTVTVYNALSSVLAHSIKAERNSEQAVAILEGVAKEVGLTDADLKRITDSIAAKFKDGIDVAISFGNEPAK